MYLSYLPPIQSPWIISENDEEYNYLELTGYSGEFRVYLTEDHFDNPDKPYKLGLDQTKGILERFDYSTLETDSFYTTPKKAAEAMTKLIKSIAHNYKIFLPVTNEVFLALGDSRHLDSFQKIMGGEFKLGSYKGQSLVFRRVSLTRGSSSYEDSAIKSIRFLIDNSSFEERDFSDCFLCNKEFQWIDDIELETLNSLFDICNVESRS